MKLINRLLLILFLFAVQLSLLLGQVNKKKGPDIYVGFSGGINFTQPRVINEYGIISSLSATDNEDFTKDYSSLFSNFSNQFQFIFWYPVKEELHVGLCPGLATYTYSYTATADWTDDVNSDITTLTNNHKQKLRYIEIPLIVRYVLRQESISPYIQAGGSYNILLSAQKETSGNLVQQISAGEFPINSQSNSGEVESSYINSRLAIFGGVGAAIDLKYVVLTLDANYHYGLNNIVNETNRYSDATFSGATYDIQDDLKLSHLIFNMGILFPINQIKNRGSLECIYFKERNSKKRK